MDMNSFTGINEAVVVDIETTGLDPKNDRIVSVALIRSDFEKLRENPNDLNGVTMDAVINPQCHIPKAASRIHGITNNDVADKSPFSEDAQEMRDFIGDRPIIAHNVSFDKRFLNAEFKRAGVKTLARNRSYCTMRRFQEFNGGRRKGSNLNDVVQILGVEKRKKTIHNAIEDARLAWKVAILFYMMDNQLNIPDGKPVPPSRGGEIDEDRNFRNQQRESKSYVWIVVLAVIVVGLLIWLNSG